MLATLTTNALSGVAPLDGGTPAPPPHLDTNSSTSPWLCRTQMLHCCACFACLFRELPSNTALNQMHCHLANIDCAAA